MNPFTAAVAGGALTVGNHNPRRSRRPLTGENAQPGIRGREHENLGDKQRESKMDDQDEARQQQNDKRDRECIIL